MAQCPNVLPGATCVDENCVYCKIARSEEPKPKEVRDFEIMHFSLNSDGQIGIGGRYVGLDRCR